MIFHFIGGPLDGECRDMGQVTHTHCIELPDADIFSKMETDLIITNVRMVHYRYRLWIQSGRASYEGQVE